MKKFLLSFVAFLFAAINVNADVIAVDFSQFGDGVDATGTNPIVQGDFSFVRNNSKVTLTKNGFYTGGSSSATARYATYTATAGGTLTVEATASGDNQDRYIGIAAEALAPAADGSNVLAKTMMPTKGQRVTASYDVEAGNTYFLVLYGNGTITAISCETTSTTPAITMTDLALAADEDSFDDGWMKINFTYNGTINDKSLNNDYLDAVVKYSVYGRDQTTVCENATATFGVEAGKAGIWVEGLSANSEYYMTINEVIVKNNAEIDQETFVAPVIFQITEGLPSLTFSTPSEKESATIVVTPAEGTVESLKDFIFTMSDGGNITPCSDNTYDLYITNEAGEKVATITQDALQAGVVTEGEGWDQIVVAINVSLDEAITVDGTYTLNIPAGAFYVGDDWDFSAAATVTYTVANPTGINNANVSSNSTVRYNANGARVNANAKGLLIVNGKKIMTK